MSDLDEAKGLHVGKTYRNSKQAQECMHAIARTQHPTRMAAAKYLWVISDGSTDSSITEAVICYVKYAVNGAVHTDFIGVRNVGKADAETQSMYLGMSILNVHFFGK